MFLPIRRWLSTGLAPLRRSEGQAMAEYGLLLVLIVIGVIVGVVYFRDQLVAVFQRMANALRQ